MFNLVDLKALKDDLIKTLLSTNAPSWEIIQSVYKLNLENYTPYVEIKDSPLHGKGVFATQSIPKGAILTFYPCHSLCIQDKITGNNTFYYSDDRKFRDVEYGISQLETSELTAICIGDPTRVNDLAYVGHMCNDFLSSQDGLNVRPKSIAEFGVELLQYEILNQAKCNVTVVNKDYYIYLEAKRDIDRGEELLVKYGYAHWTELPPVEYMSMFRQYIASLTNTNFQYALQVLAKSGIHITPRLSPPSEQNIVLPTPQEEKKVIVVEENKVLPGYREGSNNSVSPKKGTIYVIGGLSTGSLLIKTVEKFCLSENKWKSCANFPICLMAATAVIIGTTIYVMGGSTSKNPTPVSGVYEYNILTNEWKEISVLPIERHRHSTVVVNDCIYLMGGLSEKDILITRVDKYNPKTDTWSTCAPVPKGRFGCAAIAIEHNIYLIGGGSGKASNANREKTMITYNTLTNIWFNCADMSTNRFDLAAVLVNNEIYVLGGQMNISKENTSSIEKYDPKVNRWQIVGNLSIGTAAHNAVAIDQFIFVSGGIHKKTLDTMDCFDTVSGRWITYPNMSTTRKYHCSVSINWEPVPELPENKVEGPGLTSDEDINLIGSGFIGPMTNAFCKPIGPMTSAFPRSEINNSSVPESEGPVSKPEIDPREAAIVHAD
jgi:N-acetylneuraminic acid mutarotase